MESRACIEGVEKAKKFGVFDDGFHKTDVASHTVQVQVVSIVEL